MSVASATLRLERVEGIGLVEDVYVEDLLDVRYQG